MSIVYRNVVYNSLTYDANWQLLTYSEFPLTLIHKISRTSNFRCANKWLREIIIFSRILLREY